MTASRLIATAFAAALLVFALSPSVSLANPTPVPAAASSAALSSSATSAMTTTGLGSGATGAMTTTGHIVDGSEIQGAIDAKAHSEDADRQVLRDLLARPDVRRVAGKAGFDLTHADAAVNTLSGPELSRLAQQARDVNSQLAGGATVTMTWTMVIIIVVAIVVLIAIL